MNAFQWDAYRPLVDRISACTGQGGADTPGTKGRHPPVDRQTPVKT